MDAGIAIVLAIESGQIADIMVQATKWWIQGSANYWRHLCNYYDCSMVSIWH